MEDLRPPAVQLREQLRQSHEDYATLRRQYDGVAEALLAAGDCTLAAIPSHLVFYPPMFEYNLIVIACFHRGDDMGA
jgi:hypothetical protein